ncbi:TfoX/Sxy family protein [Tabrizicola sp.]|uniref:TfoX/Sxy family protein n=1 Tax=Tabrizicola sp. TaxID=2005166 RepID=UPI002735AF3E|nr:TfoX/Sxy family protein [Tabrizicola sp.]MDP3195944.1 TfoX/Sxy family protein [Tabrizicola sp.]
MKHILDALAPLALSARKMFGEYALYLDGKVVALVCNDQLFLKPTPGAQAALPGSAQGAPYPGAKSHLLVTDTLDDPESVVSALKAIAAALPAPKPKPKKSKA